jgi:hypothetical protein
MSNAQALVKTTDLKKMKSGAIGLVQRARVGDQNAMAMIIMVRRSAAAGSARAKQTLRVIKEYIRNNPMPNVCKVGFGCTPATQAIVNRMHSRIGAEPQAYVSVVSQEVPRIEDAYTAAVTLANSGDLIHDRNGKIARTQDANPRIRGILKKLNPQCQSAFIYGMESCHKPLHKLQPSGEFHADAPSALHIGRTIGIARRIQAVRLPHVSIATISPMAAWELGE